MDDEEGFNPIEYIADGLVERVAGEEWNGWVFVFGTVIAAAAKGPVEREAQEEYLFFNFAPIIEGGPGGKRLLAPKEYVSFIDFLRPMEESSDGITRIPWAFDVTDKDAKGRHHYDFDLWEKVRRWSNAS